MKYGFYLVVFFLAAVPVYAQHTEQVVNTEKAFAKYAADHNPQAAFLQFMDSSAVVFREGKILRAREVWANYTPAIALTWQPAFAGISRSGELGFTTGPWQVRKTLQDTALNVGSFATVWKKTTSGEWKFMVDLGVSYKKPQQPALEVIVIKNTGSLKKGQMRDAMQIERVFLDELNTKGRKIFGSYLHPNCWLNVEGYPPVRSTKAAKHFNPGDQLTEKYIPAGGGISSAGDLAYIYGSAEVSGKTENYLRVWQNTGSGWKIVMMTGPFPK